MTGTTGTKPSAEWDLNPDTIMVPAGGTVTLQPKIISGATNVMLNSETHDSGLASVSLDQSILTTSQNGSITITAGSTPGFYHFAITGTDGVAPQTQGGWIIVGNPPASLSKTVDGGQGGTLTVNLAPGSSGGAAAGASIFFSTDNGSLSQRIVTTDSSGNASVMLMLPSGLTAHVTAEGPYGLGHPMVTFTETAP
jgi:hypothetical protein